LKKVKKVSPKLQYLKLVLIQTETESNRFNIALVAVEAYSRPCKYTHIHWCLQYNSLKQNQFLI